MIYTDEGRSEGRTGGGRRRRLKVANIAVSWSRLESEKREDGAEKGTILHSLYTHVGASERQGDRARHYRRVCLISVII